MKKLLASSTILTMMMVAMPALAGIPPMHSHDNDIEVENNNHAYVSNTVGVSSSTGNNEITTVKGGGNSGDISTGNAYSGSVIENQVNYNDAKIKASCRRGCTGDIEVENDNGAMVKNAVGAYTETGSNEIVTKKGGSNSGGNISTGNAASVSDVLNVINTNITRVRR